MSVLKQKYNNLLIRQYKAAEYLNDESKPGPERDKWVPEYKRIVDELSVLLTEIRKTESVTDNEIINGFKEI